MNQTTIVLQLLKPSLRAGRAGKQTAFSTGEKTPKERSTLFFSKQSQKKPENGNLRDNFGGDAK